MSHSVIKKILPNQVTLILVPLPETAAVTCTVLMAVGSRYESDQQQGLAHFTEHMVFKGGKQFPTAQSIAQELDGVGGEFNAFTSQEFTGFYTKTAAPHLEIGLQVLSDMLLSATFPDAELAKEKGVIVEEINMYEDMPMRKVDEVFNLLVFGDTALGRSVAGTKKSVTAFTRQDFLDYRTQFYHGPQCTISIAGALDVEKATALVEQYFGALPEGKRVSPPAAAFNASAQRISIDERKSEQTHLMLGVHGYDLNHPKRYAYRLLATILGGNMSSRLFVSVREEQGLCYYVRAMPDTYVDTGMLVASAGVDNARLPLAIQAITREMARMRDELVSEEELNRAKQFALGKLLLSLEDSEQVSEFYGMQYLLEGEMLSPAEISAKLEAVTAAEIQDVAQEVMRSEHIRLALVGPHQNTAELEALLTL